MGYDYCVFGAGRQGIAAIYDLVKYCDADRVLALEPSKEAHNKASARLRTLLPSDFEFNKIVLLPALYTNDDLGVDWFLFDVMISCAPWEENLELAEFAAHHGVPFCDLGGNPDTVAAQQKIETETAIVPDCGLSPGISNILAVHLVNQGCDEIRVRCGGIPDRSWEDGLNYRLTFSAMGLLSEYSGKVPILVNGDLQYIDALSVIEPLGNDYECSPTSNNSPQVVEYLRYRGVLDYDYMTVRYPGHWDFVRGWQKAGFLCGHLGLDKSLATALENNPNLRYNPEYHHDKILLSVQGRRGIGEIRESMGFNIVVNADSETDFSAMELMTSWGITMVAHYMAMNPKKTPDGFSTPEMFMPPLDILSGMGERLGV